MVMANCVACGKPKPRAAVAFCSPACYHANHRSRPAAERFWEKVERSDGCWEWTGYIDPTGAGKFGADPYRPTSAYRYSWTLHYGPIPTGLYVCHKCDNRACVRPDHLFLGTALDNQRDSITKGRHFDLGAWNRAHPERRHHLPPMRGDANPSAKLTAAKVAAIRAAWPGESQPVLARRYGVSQSVIWSVVHHKTWK